MSKQASFEDKEITEETNSVMKKFFKKFSAMFINDKQSCYSIDKLCGNDIGKLKKLIRKKGNCHVRSLIQCLYRLGYTIEIKIVKRKMRSGQMELRGCDEKSG